MGKLSQSTHKTVAERTTRAGPIASHQHGRRVATKIPGSSSRRRKHGQLTLHRVHRESSATGLREVPGSQCASPPAATIASKPHLGRSNDKPPACPVTNNSSGPRERGDAQTNDPGSQPLYRVCPPSTSTLQRVVQPPCVAQQSEIAGELELSTKRVSGSTQSEQAWLLPVTAVPPQRQLITYQSRRRVGSLTEDALRRHEALTRMDPMPNSPR